MNKALTQSWRILALRGAIAIVFGVLAIAWPGLTLLWLAALFAAYALLSGAVAVIGVVRAKKSDDDHRWLMLLLGAVSIGAGVIAIVHPGLTALALVLIIGANALISQRRAVAGDGLPRTRYRNRKRQNHRAACNSGSARCAYALMTAE